MKKYNFLIPVLVIFYISGCSVVLSGCILGKKRGKEKVKFIVMVSKELWEKLKILGKKMDVTPNRAAVIILSLYVDKYAEALGIDLKKAMKEKSES